MTILYIRHGEKTHKNGSKTVYSHDPELTKNGKIKAIDYGSDLVKTYGKPDVIYCSPFERTRQTMNCLVSELKLKDSEKIHTYVYPEMTDYLAKWDKSSVTLRPETLKYGSPIYTLTEFEKSIQKHLDDFKNLDHSKMVIWIITHRINIRKMAQIYRLEERKVPYLGTLVVDGDGNAKYLF